MVHQALHDADCLIADTALQLAKRGHVVSVIASYYLMNNDTDVLVLLVHHFRPEIADIFSEPVGLPLIFKLKACQHIHQSNF